MWLTGAAFCAAVGTTAASAVGQFVMDRTGTVGIESDAERKLFFSLLCTCGCPRETLGTCTCGFAHQRRDELRVELAEGKSTAEIQADYVARFGTQALAVPPNEGSQRWLFVAPLVAIAAGAGFVVMSLRRWQKTGGKKPPGDDAPKGGSGKDAGPPKRDAYDDKLDAELGRLDE
jgi:cytochrome c-type biogenesis protein CcmH